MTSAIRQMRAAVESLERHLDRALCPDCGDEPVVSDGQKCAGCLALDAAEAEYRCPQCRTSIVEAEGVLCSDQCEAESARDFDADRRLEAQRDDEMRETEIDRAEYLIEER